jgi:Phage Mu protein F like protein
MIVPNLSNLSTEALLTMRDSLKAYLFKQATVGEQYHPSYKRNKKVFRQLVKATVALNNDIEDFFADQWKRIYTLVNITKIQATVVEDEYINIEYWKEDDKTLNARIELDIGEMFKLGALATDELFKTTIQLDPNDTSVQKFLRSYTLNLAGQVNQTTKERIVEQIRTSLKIGETRDLLVDRLEKIVLDPKRALKIAQTESIRAYAEGTLETGRRIGAKKKKWMTTYDPCPLCKSFDGKVIGIDELFGGTYNGPPGHPHCKCLLELVVDPKDIDYSNIVEPSL